MKPIHQDDNEVYRSVKPPKKTNYRMWVVMSGLGLLAVTQLFDITITPRFSFGSRQQANITPYDNDADLLKKVLPTGGVTIPVQWGDLGKQMVEAGVIDKDKLEAIYAQRGGLDKYAKNLLFGEHNGRLKIDDQNANLLLNLLWAFGLANKNPVLEEGPMRSPQYGGDASRFASTGGWTLASGNAMDHYSRHPFVTLTGEQQALVERVSQNIYRPCCGNSTYFPDCNHGMAMLGLLELMASQGVSEPDMYRAALQINSYWFPDTYLTIAKYFRKRGIDWARVNPKEILGSAYSSAQGYQQILAEIEPPQSRGGGGCGV